MSRTFTRRFEVWRGGSANSSLVRPRGHRTVKERLASGDLPSSSARTPIAGKGSTSPTSADGHRRGARFGAAQKPRLRAADEGVHVLTLTATPIPRTLQPRWSACRS
jgi:transcription-repair coupling factor (superfamily II helicase)